MTNIRMAQYRTKHGHATGKLVSMQTNPDVEVAGVYEPDDARRQELANGDGPFQNVHWSESEDEMLSDESIVAIVSERANIESLSQTEAIVQAGKHVWYDTSGRGLDAMAARGCSCRREKASDSDGVYVPLP